MLPVSTTEDMARLARLAGAVADEGDRDYTAEEIIRTLKDSAAPTIAEAMAALKPPRPFNPEMVPLDLTDEEIDWLAFQNAMETVFRGRPSMIVGPIPR